MLVFFNPEIGTNILVESGPGNNGNESVPTFPKAPRPPTDVLISYQNTHWWGLTPLQRCNRCFVQPQPTEVHTEVDNHKNTHTHTHTHIYIYIERERESVINIPPS